MRSRRYGSSWSPDRGRTDQGRPPPRRRPPPDSFDRRDRDAFGSRSPERWEPSYRSYSPPPPRRGYAQSSRPRYHERSRSREDGYRTGVRHEQERFREERFRDSRARDRYDRWEDDYRPGDRYSRRDEPPRQVSFRQFSPEYEPPKRPRQERRRRPPSKEVWEDRGYRDHQTDRDPAREDYDVLRPSRPSREAKIHPRGGQRKRQALQESIDEQGTRGRRRELRSQRVQDPPQQAERQEPQNARNREKKESCSRDSSESSDLAEDGEEGTSRYANMMKAQQDAMMRYMHHMHPGHAMQMAMMQQMGYPPHHPAMMYAMGSMGSQMGPWSQRRKAGDSSENGSEASSDEGSSEGDSSDSDEGPPQWPTMLPPTGPIETFLSANRVDPNSQVSFRLRSLPPHLAAEVVHQGPLQEPGNSSDLQARINEIESRSMAGTQVLFNARSQGGSRPSKRAAPAQNTRTSAIKEAKKDVEDLISNFELTPELAWSLRSLTPHQLKQAALIDPTGHKDPAGYVAEALLEITR